MELWEKIIETYPEINPTDSFESLGILLVNDGDNIDYIAKWDYEKPIPEGLTLGKPSQE